MVAKWLEANLQSRYPVVTTNYKTRKDYDKYGPIFHYSVSFDEDNHEVHYIGDTCMLLQEDYLLSSFLPNEKYGKTVWIGVKNIVDENSSDLWQGLLGDGNARFFSRLSDALRVYDKHVIYRIGRRKKKPI
eukprot:CCRYP_010706-RA/>CCRYP_010706-RA protein AED:0.08 eAED:-0.03 QI:0/0/0/1/0/0/2/0/130